MSSLYSILGTRKNAKPETIKKAYRKAAMKAHPDVGGSDEEMAAITEAYRILSNPEWRKHYDETGEIPREARAATCAGDDDELRHDTRVVGMVLEAFDHALGNPGGLTRVPRLDIKERMLRYMDSELLTLQREIRKAREVLQQWEAIQKRIVDGDYIMAHVARKVVAARHSIEEGEAIEVSAKDAIAWVKDEFEFDREQVAETDFQHFLTGGPRGTASSMSIHWE